MAIIDNAVTFEGREAGFFLKPILQEPTLASLGWQFVYGQDDLWVYFNSKKDKLTKEKTTCGTNVPAGGAEITRKKLEYVELQAFDGQCYKTFDNTIMAALRKTGNAKADLTGTDIEDVLVAIFGEAVSRDMLRIALLGDTTLLNNDYNMIDGWYKKLQSDADVIASGVTLNSTTLNPTNFKGTIFDIYAKRSRLAKQEATGNLAWYVTRAVADAMEEWSISNDYTDISRAKFETGQQVQTLFGIEVKTLDIVDEYEAADFNVSGADAYKIVLAKKDQTFVALDSQAAGKELEIWYDKKDEMNYFRSTYNMDIQIGYGEYFVTAGV